MKQKSPSITTMGRGKCQTLWWYCHGSGMHGCQWNWHDLLMISLLTAEANIILWAHLHPDALKTHFPHSSGQWLQTCSQSNWKAFQREEVELPRLAGSKIWSPIKAWCVKRAVLHLPRSSFHIDVNLLNWMCWSSETEQQKTWNCQDRKSSFCFPLSTTWQECIVYWDKNRYYVDHEEMLIQWIQWFDTFNISRQTLKAFQSGLTWCLQQVSLFLTFC